MHLEPVERPDLDRLDDVGGLDCRLFLPVAADERGSLEDDVVELALAEDVRAAGADERARIEPVAA